MILWHPDATKQIFGASGKPWIGGKGNRKLLLHSTETTGWPNYSAPPHLTLNPHTGELRQHVPFDESSYALRLNAGEDDRYIWQVELIGRAANVPTYQDIWYYNLAALIRWFHDEMGVPYTFADFSVMEYGKFAPQRWTQDQMDVFSGICGHGHHGYGVDTHWDPGLLDVTRLQTILELDPSLPPPPPPDEEGDYEMKTIRQGDGYKDGDNPERRNTVKAGQILLAANDFADAETVDGTCAADGAFGPGTDTATRAFQTAKGLMADGIIGSKTWRALEG